MRNCCVAELLAKEDLVAESSLPPLLQEIMTPLNLLLVGIYVRLRACLDDNVACVCTV